MNAPMYARLLLALFLAQLATSFAVAQPPRTKAAATNSDEQLAQQLLRERRWNDALTVFKRWRPVHFCGTCSENMERNRLNGISECLIHLGRQPEAAEVCWEAVQREVFSENEFARDSLVRLYASAGQSGDVLELIEKLIALAEASLKIGDARTAFYAHRVESLRNWSAKARRKLPDSPSKWAETPDGLMNEAAERLIDDSITQLGISLRLQQKTHVEDTWPANKAGSLPNTLPQIDSPTP
jgi:hypothetical protein